MPNNKESPVIKISKITEHEDGSATYDFEYDEDFVSFIKERLDLKKKPTKKQIYNFILECIKRTVEHDKEIV
jgi:hypothetical protein